MVCSCPQPIQVIPTSTCFLHRTHHRGSSDFHNHWQTHLTFQMISSFLYFQYLPLSLSAPPGFYWATSWHVHKLYIQMEGDSRQSQGWYRRQEKERSFRSGGGCCMASVSFAASLLPGIRLALQGWIIDYTGARRKMVFSLCWSSALFASF